MLAPIRRLLRLAAVLAGVPVLASALPVLAQTEDPGPNTCHDRCVADAHELYRACVVAGGSDEDCAARARQALADCVATNCGPPICEDRWSCWQTETRRTRAGFSIPCWSA